MDAATAVDANYRAHSSLQNRADAVSHSDHSHHPLLQEEQRNESGLPTVSRKTRFQVTADSGTVVLAFCWAHLRRDFL
ncbi:MAG: hypothetical protein OXT70_12650, partial [Chloroflexota bacterium]|nr:hypothetical protein [Chloroflexota bacterium]